MDEAPPADADTTATQPADAGGNSGGDATPPAGDATQEDSK
jgi:hypothetical protein